MPGSHCRVFIDDDAIFESNSLPIHGLAYLICVAKISFEQSTDFFIDDDIDIITAQYQRSKSTNEKTIAQHYNAIFEIKNTRLMITIICDAKNIDCTKYQQ